MTSTTMHERHATRAPRPDLLCIEHLNVSFRAQTGPRSHVVRDVSFGIGAAEIVGVVGESGCGKSVTAQSILRLLPPSTTETTGSIFFCGRDLVRASDRELESIRGGEIGMIFQEPMTALDPTYPVGKQIAEVLRAHRDVTRQQARAAAIDMLGAVGIPDPSRRFSAFPHQLSGGMRQRVAIAVALVCEPKLVIADEPTTALDVTIQAQILDLLRRLAQEAGAAVLLITHDLGVVSQQCDRVVTLYAGEVVEAGPTKTLLDRPRHPYTAGLLRSIPRLHERDAALAGIPGRVPSPHEPTAACRFVTRCEHAIDRCQRVQELRTLEADGRVVRCCRAEELDLTVRR